MFLQNAMFARQPGMQDYEFIYVSNSPHIAEQLLKEARTVRADLRAGYERGDPQRQWRVWGGQ